MWELAPPWASRMMAMPAMYPIGLTSQAHSGNRSQGTRKAAAPRPKQMPPVSTPVLVGLGSGPRPHRLRDR